MDVIHCFSTFLVIFDNSTVYPALKGFHDSNAWLFSLKYQYIRFTFLALFLTLCDANLIWETAVAHYQSC